MGWMRRVFGALVATTIGFIIGQPSILAEADSCLPCPIPCARPQDHSFSVRLTGGRTDIRPTVYRRGKGYNSCCLGDCSVAPVILS